MALTVVVCLIPELAASDQALRLLEENFLLYPGSSRLSMVCSSAASSYIAFPHHSVLHIHRNSVNHSRGHAEIIAQLSNAQSRITLRRDSESQVEVTIIPGSHASDVHKGRLEYHPGKLSPKGYLTSM
jgi:hypothetical protein